MLLPDNENEVSMLPVTAALCFGLHPVNTESVNWISGRTDVMAGAFILLTTLYLLKFKKEHKKRFLVVSSLSLLLAVLTKEVAMAFLPAAFLILTAHDSDNLTTRNHTDKANQKLLPAVCLFLIVLALLYFLLRSGFLSSNTSNLGKTIKKITADPNHALFVCLRAFGFYIKKLYAPFPLDFTIAAVDPLYELLALPLLLLCFLVALNRTLPAALFTAGILLITPSLLVAFGNIAWMPYAERYVYVSSAFVIIPTAFYIRKRLEPLRNRTLIKAGVSVLLIILSLATLERNIYWMNTTPPYKDVKWIVDKDSPGK
jgi:protein O-mannosyl-transferase